MAKGKAKASNIALDNLKGFFQFGAETNIPGYIPTGHPKLDFALHYGEDLTKVDLSTIKGYDPSTILGLPLGRIVEVFGKPGSGKSSLAYRTCGYAQKLGYRVAWIDAEQSFSEALAVINSVDIDPESQNFLLSDLTNRDDAEKVFAAEDVFNNIIELCKMNAKGFNLGVIVVDSVASLVPKALMESKAEELKPGALARLMAENLKKVGNYAAKFGVLVIFINQIREKIGVMFGCASYSTKILLADGSWRKIGPIVENKEEVEVLSYDPKTGKVVPKKVIGWHNNGSLDESSHFSR
ncbi:MAG: hypothetical protein HC888_00385 [Candidatus Competibacteraceae bacterium]|nr:hypothetical protein [Candidatus Competibacteraceae bacterium]